MFGTAAVIYAVWIGMKSSSRPLSLSLSPPFSLAFCQYFPSVQFIAIRGLGRSIFKIT